MRKTSHVPAQAWKAAEGHGSREGTGGGQCVSTLWISRGLGVGAGSSEARGLRIEDRGSKLNAQSSKLNVRNAATLRSKQSKWGDTRPHSPPEKKA